VGEYAHTFVELSHPPTPPALDICTDLACEPAGCHMDSFPQPPSPHSVDPPDFIVLCSYILDSTLVVNEDQDVGEVGVMQPTCTIIHDECVWESKEGTMVKDDSFLAMPHPLYPNIPFDSVTVSSPYENSFSDASIFDHS